MVCGARSTSCSATEDEMLNRLTGDLACRLAPQGMQRVGRKELGAWTRHRAAVLGCEDGQVSSGWAGQSNCSSARSGTGMKESRGMKTIAVSTVFAMFACGALIGVACSSARPLESEPSAQYKYATE